MSLEYAYNENGSSVCCFPNLARSVSTSFMGDLKTQKIYFLFDTNRGGRLIYTYAPDTKEWNALSNIGFPYSEIVLAR
ncbi:DUF4784 domain-containing protein [Bacteroides pyogenes]|nr:DUF4784 domain-containing protein [Bacteroides pyogenes]